MKYYKLFLRLFGLKTFISKNSSNINNENSSYVNNGNNDIQRVDIFIKDGEINQEIVKVKKSFYKNKYLREIINWTYITFVGLLLLFPCLFAIGKSIEEKSPQYFTTSMFQIMFLLQFLSRGDQGKLLQC